MTFSGYTASLSCLLLACGLAGCMTAERKFQRATQDLQRDALVRVGSEADLEAFRARAAQAQEARRLAEKEYLCKSPDPSLPAPWQCREYLGMASDDSITLDTIAVTGSRLQVSDVITNNQSSGVDEGDIVKKSGDFVLVLRQGVLYSLRIQRGGNPVLELADRLGVAVDESGEDVWYDEILVAGPRIILLGFNFGERDGVAELLLFELDANGKLSRDGRFWLRSGDYFSGTNYGARLQDQNLLITLALPLELEGDMPWPEWSRRDVAVPRWTALLEAEQLLYPVLLDDSPYVHVVMQCPLSGLAGDELKCRNTGIVGNEGAVVYASASHAYLALAGWDSQAFGERGFSAYPHADESTQRRFARHRRTAILRVPLDARKTSGFAVLRGSVHDQFQFHEADDGSLFMAAYRSDVLDEGVELVRILPGQFTAAGAKVQPALASLTVDPQASGLRFSSKALWLGRARSMEASTGGASLLRRQPLDGSPAASVELPQSSEMLQPAFGQIISVGVDGSQGLSFANVTDENKPRLLSQLAFPTYEGSESRSHALNFGRLPGGTMLMGLPGMPSSAWQGDDFDGRASDLVYVLWRDGRLVNAGVLDMRGQPEPNDGSCKNCWDWYGNARTFFIGGRIFALSANRVTEALFDGQRVVEQRQLTLP